MGNTTTGERISHSRDESEIFRYWGPYVQDVLYRLLKEENDRNPMAVVRLRNMTLGPGGARALYLFLLDNKTATELNLRGNNFGKHSMSHIAELMKLTTTIQDLDLSENLVGDLGVQVWLKFLFFFLESD